MTQYRLIVTEQTLGGMMERAVAEGAVIESILLVETMWATRERTLMTRIEMVGDERG